MLELAGFIKTPAVDNSSKGLVTVAKARVKTGLVVFLAMLEQPNVLISNGQLLGPFTKGR